MIKRMSTLNRDGDVVDLTSATSDYMLDIGETAVVNYSAAISVPLHVKTVEGEYELILDGIQTGVTIGNDNYVILHPNAGLTGNAIGNWGSSVQSNGSLVPLAFAHNTGIILGSSLLRKSVAKISTLTLYKSVVTQYISQLVSTYSISGALSAFWESTYTTANGGAEITTPWTSLGTLSFPFAQSGRAIIRRIA